MNGGEPRPVSNDGAPASGQTRVLHLIDGLAGGGSERLLWDLVRLSPPDVVHQVVTILPDHGDYVYAGPLRRLDVYKQRPAGRVLRSLYERRRGGAPWLRRMLLYPWLGGSLAVATPSVPRAIRRFRPDVLHAHALPFAFLAGLLARRLTGIPLIYTMPCLFAQMHDANVGWMQSVCERFRDSVDHFFTGASVDELRAIGVPPARLTPLTGVLDLGTIDEVAGDRRRHRQEVRAALGLPDDALIALSVGRLHRSKGHEYALRSLPGVLASFPNLHWIVLGEGEERSTLERAAGTLGISSHVHLIGFQPDPLPYYAAADVYLRTVLMEAENLSSYQALALGVPVVGFDTGAETELIPKVGHGLLVPTADFEALARGVTELLSLPDRGSALGSRGISYSREHLSIQRSVDAYASVYRRLAAGPRTVPANRRMPAGR